MIGKPASFLGWERSGTTVRRHADISSISRRIRNRWSVGIV